MRVLSPSSPWQKPRCIRLVLHPVWRRCSSVTNAPICSLVAPCQPGAAPISVQRGVLPRAASSWRRIAAGPSNNNSTGHLGRPQAVRRRGSKDGRRGGRVRAVRHHSTRSITDAAIADADRRGMRGNGARLLAAERRRAGEPGADATVRRRAAAGGPRRRPRAGRRRGAARRRPLHGDLEHARSDGLGGFPALPARAAGRRPVPSHPHPGGVRARGELRAHAGDRLAPQPVGFVRRVSGGGRQGARGGALLPVQSRRRAYPHHLHHLHRHEAGRALGHPGPLRGRVGRSAGRSPRRLRCRRGAGGRDLLRRARRRDRRRGPGRRP